MFWWPDLRRWGRTIAVLAMGSMLAGAAKPDPANPTCPANPGWSTNSTMVLTPKKVGNRLVLLAEGKIDAGLPDRMEKALADNPDIGEIWLSSPGGLARSGNATGHIIRSHPGLLTRVPRGWVCFSACNFVFMGGQLRAVEPGGVFMVHMFTRTGDRSTIDMSVAMGTEATTELIGDIEQDSALLASEDNDFLIRMGVSRKLLTEVMYQQKAVAGQGDDRSTRRCLTQAEVHKYNVANIDE